MLPQLFLSIVFFCGKRRLPFLNVYLRSRHGFERHSIMPFPSKAFREGQGVTMAMGHDEYRLTDAGDVKGNSTLNSREQESAG